MKIIGVKNERTPAAIQFTVSVNRSGSVLTFNIVSIDTLVEDRESDRYRVEDTCTVDITALRERRDWCDHQVYFMATESRKFIPLIALYPETLEQRETAVDYATRLKRHLLIGINVPYESGSDDEVFVTVNLSQSAEDSNLVVSGDLEKVWSDAGSSGTERVLRFPHIKATAPQTMAADATAVVSVRLEDAAENLIEKNATVFVDAINGFSGTSRLQIVNGIGQFPVSSSGMQPGSVLRMKLGWKYYVGVEDVYITVT